MTKGIMPLIGLIVALIGGVLYGFLIGGSIHGLYLLRGAPGATGLEILVVLMAVIQGAFAGASAAIVTLIVPRLSWSWGENMIVLVLATVVSQLMLSWTAFSFASVFDSVPTPYDFFAVSILMISPINWARMNVNWIWLATVPVILLICSPWFRSKFDS